MCDTIDYFNTKQFKSGIWKFFEKNKDICNNVLDKNFGYKSVFHIQSIFNWFTNCPIFGINIKNLLIVIYSIIKKKKLNFIVL